MQAEKISGDGNPYAAFCVDEVNLFLSHHSTVFLLFDLKQNSAMEVCYIRSEGFSALQDALMDTSQTGTSGPSGQRAEPMDEEYALYLPRLLGVFVCGT